MGEAQLWANKLILETASLPKKYLGLPLCSSRLSTKDCLPLIKRTTNIITMWQSGLLLYAGRLELIRSVLLSFCTFWLSSFVLPKAILRKIKSQLNKFLWEGPTLPSKIYPASVDKVCRSKAVLALGIKNMEQRLLLWPNLQDNYRRGFTLGKMVK